MYQYNGLTSECLVWCFLSNEHNKNECPVDVQLPVRHTANLPTNIVDFTGFDSSIILI